mmetsp:Transcript_64526/g.97238  ORF Transcript_64526/g.97238 Transcript_64526/m.97238 type:complete len:304 (-) Transcript_64526:278-1189(-)
MLNNKRAKRASPNHDDITLWDAKLLQSAYRNPHLMLIDLRSPGNFRGGPPPNPKSIPAEYHQGHIFLALNLNLQNVKTVEDVEEEIQTGRNSAGGSFVDTMVLAITSGFHFLFYTQDGSNKDFIMGFLASARIIHNGEAFTFPEQSIHWLEGGFNAIYRNSSLKKFCADTKNLLGREEEIEEPEYSAVLPHLFVGGAICSEVQFDELQKLGVEHIINVSNMDRPREGFKCTFIFANDDQDENLTRLFYQVADLIEESEQKGEGVFVHCQRGLSRSPTLIMAYLMIKKKYSLREAFELVKKKEA